MALKKGVMDLVRFLSGHLAMVENTMTIVIVMAMRRVFTPFLSVQQQ